MELRFSKLVMYVNFVTVYDIWYSGFCFYDELRVLRFYSCQIHAALCLFVLLFRVTKLIFDKFHIA